MNYSIFAIVTAEIVFLGVKTEEWIAEFYTAILHAYFRPEKSKLTFDSTRDAFTM